MATYFNKPYPARATYQVAALPRGALIEVEGTVVLPGAAVEAQTGWRETFDQTKGHSTESARAGPRAARPGRGRGLADQLARLGPHARRRCRAASCRCATRTTRGWCRSRRLQPGLAVQTEGVVVNTDIQYRPRRQLVCLIADPDQRDAQLVLRFFTFYPSQQKALQPGQRVRVFGDVRPGYFGLEIVHPQWKAIAEGAPLPDRLTPVYPTTAGLVAGNAAQARRAHARRRPGAAPRKRCRDKLVTRRKLWKFGDAVRFLHAPPPRLSELDAARARRAHASGVDAPQVRRAPRAAAVAQGAPQGACAASRAGADRHGRRSPGS